jgi:hypothetical protein
MSFFVSMPKRGTCAPLREKLVSKARATVYRSRDRRLKNDEDRWLLEEFVAGGGFFVKLDPLVHAELNVILADVANSDEGNYYNEGGDLLDEEGIPVLHDNDLKKFKKVYSKEVRKSKRRTAAIYSESSLQFVPRSVTRRWADSKELKSPLDTDQAKTQLISTGENETRIDSSGAPTTSLLAEMSEHIAGTQKVVEAPPVVGIGYLQLPPVEDFVMLSKDEEKALSFKDWLKYDKARKSALGGTKVEIQIGTSKPDELVEAGAKKYYSQVPVGQGPDQMTGRYGMPNVGGRPGIGNVLVYGEAPSSRETYEHESDGSY